jgi:hypothetical protein
LNKIYIHYGSSNFFQFRPVKNNASGIMSNKPDPHTCFWGSPTKCYKSWKDFCLSEAYNMKSLSKYFKFKLTKSCKVLEVSRNEDILNYIRKNAKGELFPFYIDYEQIRKDGYGAVEVVNPDLLYVNLTDSLPVFWGWDCISIVVLDSRYVFPLQKKMTFFH